MEFDVSVIPDATPVELDLTAARRRALELRTEIHQASLKLDASYRDRSAKRAEYIPDITAEFNSINTLNYNNFIPSHINSFGLVLTWEPFDWGRRKDELAEKDASITQAQNALSDARNKVVADVDEKFRHLRQNRARLRVADLARQTVAESLRVTQEKFKVQATLVKDVLEAQSTLEQTTADYRQALLAFWNAKTEFEHALGEEQ
jgi:outer membrane protein TolC